MSSVFFWLKPETTEQQKAEFKAALESLKGVETIQSIYIGTPVPSINRPVVDTTYSFSLLIVFNDLAGHDVYQIHPLHKAFLDGFRTYWDKVIIYDAE
ncbi:Dabb family protein [Ferruginibacter albus]|uniref:Dabb family protein n=1 Tax=Ferruginibacter albus TaxID=2875540 RepID=UPI001CC3AB81